MRLWCWIPLGISPIYTRWRNTVVEHGGGIRWRSTVAEHGGGARWWSTVAEHGGGTRWWNTLVARANNRVVVIPDRIYFCTEQTMYGRLRSVSRL